MILNSSCSLLMKKPFENDRKPRKTSFLEEVVIEWNFDET